MLIPVSIIAAAVVLTVSIAGAPTTAPATYTYLASAAIASVNHPSSSVDTGRFSRPAVPMLDQAVRRSGYVSADNFPPCNAQNEGLTIQSTKTGKFYECRYLGSRVGVPQYGWVETVACHPHCVGTFP